jgi:hypothetical protein
VGHIASLMKQQRLFSTRYGGDSRSRLRLRAMGHSEFGPDRKPINPGDFDGTRTVAGHWEAGREVAGWAAYWRMIYAFISRLLAEDAALREASLLVRFETLCAAPEETLQAVARHCGLEGAADAIHAAAPTIRYPAYYTNNFTPDDLRTIHGVTAGVAAGLGCR